MKIIFITFTLLLSQLAQAIQCEAGNYPIFCRGKQHVSRNAEGAIFFVGLNDRGAGQYGEFLDQNTCAWGDRAISREEPNRIFFWEGFSDENRGAVDMAVQCLGDATCVIEVCAHKSVSGDGNLLFYTNSGHVMRWYPSFSEKK